MKDQNKSLIVCIEFNCNNNCISCMLRERKDKLVPVSFEEYKKIIEDNLNSRKYSRIILSGAEATTSPNLLDFVRYAKDKGKLEHIRIQTNGRKLSDFNYCKSLFDAGVDEFFISIYGPNRDIHESMTRVKGSFDETIGGIKNVDKLGGTIITNTVVTMLNYKFLPSLAEKLSAFGGVKEAQFWNYCPMSKDDQLNLIESNKKIKPYLIDAIKEASRKGISVLVKYFPECLLKGYGKFLDNSQPDIIIDELHWKPFHHSNDFQCDYKNSCASHECFGLPSAYIKKFGHGECTPIQAKKDALPALRVHIESKLEKCCPLRTLDAEKLKKYFTINGCSIVENPEGADINIVNTCGVISEAEDNSFDTIRKFLQYKGKLVVTGCIKNINPEKYHDTFKGDGFLPTELHMIDRLFPEFKHRFADLEDNGECQNAFDSSGFFKPENFDKNKSSKWFLLPGTGCDKENPCAFCVVWKSIGKYKSKPLEKCIEHIKKGVEKGHDTFLIYDAGAYGLDIGSSFPELIDRIIETEGVEHLIIYMNQRWISKYIQDLIRFVKTGKIKTISSSHQSGSDRILNLMDRGYSVDESVKSFLALKDAYSKLKVLTQIIIGFPSETEEDFLKTLKFIEKVGFDDVLWIKFNSRKGTPAYSMQNMVDEGEVRKRIKMLNDFLLKKEQDNESNT